MIFSRITKIFPLLSGSRCFPILTRNYAANCCQSSKKKPHFAKGKPIPCSCNSKKSTSENNDDPVKTHYTNIAKEKNDIEMAHQIAKKCGYTDNDLKNIPDEACLGLGCGNSVVAANPKEGEWVLDLGCGAGMDLFLAGSRVGPSGRAIGVDFSTEMVKKGMAVAKKYGKTNVEFHYSPIDSMPFSDEIFDISISNCVLNLVPDKLKAFGEIYRVLKKTGRFVVSDILVKKELPEEIRKDVAAIVGCFLKKFDFWLVFLTVFS